MPYCTSCGVEVDASVSSCPLCTSAVTENAADVRTPAGIYPATITKSDTLTGEAKLRLAREIINFIIAASAFMIVVIDLLLTRSISWSKYAFISVVLLGILANGALVLRRHPVQVGIATTLSLAVYLFLIDMFSGAIEWFLILGLPILLLFVVLFVIMVVYIRTTRRNGLNIPAFFLADATVWCVGIDMLIHIYSTGRFGLSWSVIVCVAIIVPMAVLFFIHYRFHALDMKKVFHV
ncbi:MAG: hypothetical protein HZC28_16745 [Spirochaetes bacterium]|nr:hypothetical protein [Spirochaetota bacterium]